MDVKLENVLQLINSIEEDFYYKGKQDLKYQNNKLQIGDKVITKTELQDKLVNKDLTEEQLMDFILNYIKGKPNIISKEDYLRQVFNQKVKKHSLTNALDFLKQGKDNKFYLVGDNKGKYLTYTGKGSTGFELKEMNKSDVQGKLTYSYAKELADEIGLQIIEIENK